MHSTKTTRHPEQVARPTKDLVITIGDYDSLRAAFGGCSLARRLRAAAFATLRMTALYWEEILRYAQDDSALGRITNYKLQII